LGLERISFSVSGQNPVELVGFRSSREIFRIRDGSTERITSGSSAAMRFRMAPTRLAPTGEITTFQVVETAETVNKPTRQYAPRVLLSL
jgi:hypothetical protein